MIRVDVRDTAPDLHGELAAPRDSDRPGRRWRRVLSLVGLVVGTGLIVYFAPGRRGWFDIDVYYDVVTKAVHSPRNLYDYVNPGTQYGFTYPPFAAVCMVPMVWLSAHATIAVNLVLTVIASGFVVYVLLDGLIRRQGWPRMYAYTVAGCLFVLFEPVRDTLSYGQVNLLLVALVYSDLVLLDGSKRRFAGIGTGLATAIKLTPGLFILYFVLTRRWRAAAISAGTTLAATALAAVLAPGATVAYFTHAMWDTARVGAFQNLSNQSLMGLLARFDQGQPDRLVWLVLVLAVIGGWVWRVRTTRADGNDRAGFALTGLVACLVSPITWVHHLVWIIPALVLLADSGLPFRSSDPIRRRRLIGAISIYTVMSSGILWLWRNQYGGVVNLLGSNLYMFIALGLLIWLPIASPLPTERNISPEPAMANLR